MKKFFWKNRFVITANAVATSFTSNIYPPFAGKGKISLLNCVAFLLLFLSLGCGCGSRGNSCSIEDWSSISKEGSTENKDNDRDLMYLVEPDGEVEFSIETKGECSFIWEVNKVAEEEISDSFNFKVPSHNCSEDPSECIWEVHVKAYNGNKEIHREWVISTLDEAEAPDIFDYSTDGKCDDRNEKDPWNRPLPEWNGNLADVETFSARTDPHVEMTIPSSILEGTWKFRYRFSYPSSADQGGNTHVALYPIYERGVVEYSWNKVWDAHHHCVIETWDIHDGERTQFSMDYDGCSHYEDGQWHEVILIRKGDYFYSFKEVKNESLKNSRIMFEFHAYDPVAQTSAIKLYMRNYDSDNTVHFDCMQVYQNRYLFPSKRIYTGEYFHDHTTGQDNQIAPLWKEGIIIQGRGVTLEEIADAAGDPSIFSYDPETKTATCYKDLVVDEAAELVIEDETLNFHCSYDGEVAFVLDYGSRLYVENGLITSDTDHYWVWNNSGSTTHWGNEKGMYWPGEPVGYYKSGGHRALSPAYHGEFIIKSSVIDNCAHLFLDSPYEVNITNSRFTNLHEFDMATYPYLGSNYKDSRDHSKGDKSFWVYTDSANINDFVIKNVTFAGAESPMNLTFSVNAHRDKYNIYNVDAENENIVIKESLAQNNNESHSCYVSGSSGPWEEVYVWKSYIDSEMGLVNCRFNDVIIIPEVFTDKMERKKKKSAFVKYYVDVQVVDDRSDPVPDAKVEIECEQDWAADEMKTNHYPVENMIVTKPYATGNYHCFYHHYRFVDGQPLNESNTTSTGHTPLPSEDQNRTFVAADYKRYIDENTKEIMRNDFTYTVTVEKDGKTASISNLDMDETWYRDDPDVPSKTVVCNIDAGNCWITER